MKKLIFWALGITAIGAVAYYMYQQSIAGTAPPLVVSAWNATNPSAPVATFTFGTVTGTTASSGTYTVAGGWTITNIGNSFTILNSGAVYKTVTVTGAGTY